MSPSKVLIVDDDAGAREAAEALLAAEGYEIALARGGAEALAAASARPPDVVLLDVMMPEMDGFTVCRRLKEDERTRDVPVLLVTALDRRQDVARGLDAGAQDFVSKPVNGAELRARVRSMLRLKRQHDELRAALALRDDLAHMIVHDLRTPLNVVLAYHDRLLRSSLTPDQRRMVDRIGEQAVRVNGLLHDMLLLAKLEGGRLLLSRATVDLAATAGAAAADQAAIAEARSVAVDVLLPGEPVLVEGDPSLLRRVIDNLVSNALKFGPAGSRVAVEVAREDRPAGPRVVLRVRDEGPGIPPAERARIFEKFSAPGVRMRGVVQVGLGLAFARLAVEAHGGAIAVEPNVPRGSVFVVELPG